jgi:hypothetical protein
LLVDYQVGIMECVVRVPPLDVARGNVLALDRVAQVLGLIVVLTANAEESPFQGPLMPEAEEILPEAYANRIQRTIIDSHVSSGRLSPLQSGHGRRRLRGAYSCSLSTFMELRSTASGRRASRAR